MRKREVIEAELEDATFKLHALMERRRSQTDASPALQRAWQGIERGLCDRILADREELGPAEPAKREFHHVG